MMEIAKNIITFAAIFFMAILASCQKNSPEEPLGEEIQFALSPTVEVKASTLNNSNLKNFGVYASLSKNGEELVNFMDNIPVTDQGGGWYPTPKFYWPVNELWKLNFFAYTPHNTQYQGINVPAKNNWSAGNEIIISYTPDNDPKQHADLCVATAAMGKTSGEIIEFDFNHTLSWVTFAAKYKGFVPQGCYLRIDELTLNNVIGTNTLRYNSSSTNNFVWDTPDYNEKNGTYYLSIYGSETLIKDNSLNTTDYKDIQNADGYMFLLPQIINADNHTIKSTIDVTFSYVKENDPNNTIIAQFYTTKELPKNDQLMPGYKYRYVFELDLENVSLISIGLEPPVGNSESKWITDWVPSGINPPSVTIK